MDSRWTPTPRSGKHFMVSGHVFIAYHPRELTYRDRLAAQLVAAGVAVWSQPAAEYGTGWLTVVRPRIDSCGAFIVLMTERAESSDWVDLQVARAVEVGVPILPLLLQGQWTFKRLHGAGLKTFTRVRDGLLPRQPYIDDVLAALGRSPATPPAAAAPPTLTPTVAIELPPSRVDTTGWSGAELDIMVPRADLVTWSPDGQTIAIGGDDGMTYLWDVATGTVRTTIEQAERIEVVNWSPCGASLVTGDERGAVRVWDPTTGDERVGIPAPDDHACLAAWSSDGTMLATAGQDSSTVRLWDGSTGEARAVLTAARRFRVGCGAWSPTKPTVLAVQGNRRVRVWDIADMTVLSELLPAEGYGLAWSPDGQRLATLHDETIGVWDVEAVVEQRVLIDRGNWPRCVAWSPDGRRLAVGGTDCRVRVWDPGSPHPLLVLEGHHRAVFTVSWSPDGRYLVSAGASRTPLVWDIPAVQR